MLENHLPSASVRLWSSLALKINDFAKQSLLKQRASKRFCPEDFLFTLLDVVYHQLHLGTEQHKTIGYNLLQKVLPGDLVVRAMGYSVLKNCRIIESLDAYWLSRLPLAADVPTGQ
jgi:hypothetical protein